MLQHKRGDESPLGVNLADRKVVKDNLSVYQEVKRFADSVFSSIIIVHSGSDGTLDEVVNQLISINDQRLCIENKPVKGLSCETCLGNLPDDIKYIFAATGLSGFVLDFGHAVCAANTHGMDHFRLINELLSLHPVVFHLSDGDIFSEKDMHLNIGKGNFGIKDFYRLVPKCSNLTIETPREPTSGLGDFQKDVGILNVS